VIRSALVLAMSVVAGWDLFGSVLLLAVGRAS
jgi:hypothetical protein